MSGLKPRPPKERMYEIALVVPLIRFGEKNAQVTQIGSGRAGDDGIFEFREEIVSVAVAEEGPGFETEGFGAGQRLAVCDCASTQAVAIHAIGAGAENSDWTASNSLHASKHKSGVAAAEA